MDQNDAAMNPLRINFGKQTAIAVNSFEGVIKEARFYNNLALNSPKAIERLLCDFGYYYDLICKVTTTT